ncbi:TPA: asparagine synthase [Bacillus cereus]|uniref:asparagine synthase-related protein n=1 Tax=Bacillus cereus TaxID=1396 RepID=UPI00234A206E|nr:asparagine synthase-related protein [Bacillus cereus]MEB8688154.1 asparagine synthase-related protein [Bacillus cereus]HDX9649275.1 asparagine synthase [Bacillus cereus]
MKWFLVSVSSKEKDFKNLSIKNTIFDEFKIKVEENYGMKNHFEFFSANSHKNINTKFEFGDILIIGDIVLHNKRELIREYNLSISLDEDVESEYIISYLYKEKGIEFIKDLVGEFSFVLYDQAEQKTFAVRDHIGVKTLFWVKHKDEYVLASDIFLLKSHFDFKDINYDYFKEFHERNGIIDTTDTPYNNIFRIPSGCYLNINQDVSKVQTYWDLSKVSGTISYKTEEDYFRQFSDLLFQAVKDRLDKEEGNAIMLSGGMDSTSLYAASKIIAKEEKKLHISSVSAVFDELKNCDEREYINELTHKYNDEGIYLNLDNTLMFEKFPNDDPFTFEPNVNSISFNFTYNTVKKSVENNLVNILSGFAGDHLLKGSLHTTRDFFNKGQLKKTFSWITDYSITTNTSALKNFYNCVLSPDLAKEFIGNTDSNYYKFMNKKMRNIKSFHQKELYYQITNAKAHLYIDRVIGAAVGADISHPFLDRRLIEFVYKIPGEFRFSTETTKYILRKSMEKYLTPNIVNKINKTTHLDYTYKSIRKNWDKIYRLMENPMIVEKLNLLSHEEWHEELAKWRNGLENRKDFWTLFCIEIWFIKYQQRLNQNN